MYLIYHTEAPHLKFANVRVLVCLLCMLQYRGILRNGLTVKRLPLTIRIARTSSFERTAAARPKLESLASANALQKGTGSKI